VIIAVVLLCKCVPQPNQPRTAYLCGKLMQPQRQWQYQIVYVDVDVILT
jgi:hypothetical protein